jgi:hypothetical protein
MCKECVDELLYLFFFFLIRSPLENEMNFSSRIRAKKNMALPDINNAANLYNAQRCYNANRRFPTGSVPNVVPINANRRSQQNNIVPLATTERELDNQCSTMNSSSISNASVDCALPSEFSWKIEFLLCESSINFLISSFDKSNLLRIM